MSQFHHRPYLRALTPTQRASWKEQRRRLTPRIDIGRDRIPHCVVRTFAYIKVA